MSIKIIKSAAAITCLTAMSAAAASSVSVYGVIDTGFGVSKGKGQAAKVQAISGGNAASRSRSLGGGPNAFYAKDLGFGSTAAVKGSKKGFRSDTFVIGASTPPGRTYIIFNKTSLTH